MGRRWPFGDERGELAVVDLVTGTLSAFCLVFMIVAIEQFSTEFSRFLTYEATAGPVHAALSQMDEEAASANSVFIPATDVLGASNTDGHELDMLFVTVDTTTKTNTASFVAYNWSASKKLLSRYTYLHQPGAAATQTPGFAVSATSFSVEYVNMSDAPSVLPEAKFLASLHPKDVALINLGYPGVDAGNREVHLTIANAYTAETDDLVQGQYETQVTYNVGFFTPTPVPAPSIWPDAVEYPVSGDTLVKGATCNAQPYAGTGFATISTPPPWLAGKVTLDANNCYNGRVWMHQPGYADAFAIAPGGNTCQAEGYTSLGSWNASGPTAGISVTPGSTPTPTNKTCTIDLQGNPYSAGNGILTSSAKVVELLDCPGHVPIGGTCPFTIPLGSSTGDCEIKGVGGDQVNIYYFATFDPDNFAAEDPGLTPPAYPSPYGTLAAGSTAGTVDFTRTETGSVTVYVWKLTTEIRGADCAFTHGWDPVSSITFN